MKKVIKKSKLNAEPNTSLANKTGAWRTYRPVIDHDICIGCSLCAKLCPEGCIEMKKQKKSPNKLKPEINYDYCKGCGLCVHQCPVKAIQREKDY
ncbi:MAG: 4Fe-4S dicluster-binding protein [Patescibacteria group bacterium]|jgi:2-oxoacid:acceptor oxidoreductase delta subunit (pyruvate/2-ketoisovalerate family)